MRYFIYITLSIVIYSSCKPSMEITIRPFDQEREMPRFCFTDRMFFYEISETEESLQIWIFSKDRLTIDQLISQPLNIYFSEKNKKNIKYLLKYKDLVNSNLENKKETGIQLSFLKFTNEDTLNVTADYKFNVATNYNGSQYDLKIDFPKSIFSNFEEPVVGIHSKTPKPFQKKESYTQTPQNNRSNEIEHANRQMQQPPPGQPNQYVKKIQEISLWFRVFF